MKRFKTRTISIGKLHVGGNEPICIQSMTTTSPSDIENSLYQIKKLTDSGCEMVRLAVQNKSQAYSLEKVKNSLILQGYDIPLIADVHFYPEAAHIAVEFVEKVRINPGNFVKGEEEKIEQTFIPLIEKCKKWKKVLRIGANHGSLSDRILQKYGNTAQGMVVSVMEYAHIARKYDYHDFFFSLKSSDPLHMIEGYRLLVKEMQAIDWDYPLHLGVTEAGEKEDGKIKSSVGIGTLLLEGIGDTIRVSLTDDPWFEIDPCKKLIHLHNRFQKSDGFVKAKNWDHISIHPYLHKKASVITSANQEDLLSSSFFEELGFQKKDQTIVKTNENVDAYIFDNQLIFPHLSNKQLPLIPISEIDDTLDEFIGKISLDEIQNFEKLHIKKPIFAILEFSLTSFYKVRLFFTWLKEKQLADIPIILSYVSKSSYEETIIEASSLLGSLLCDDYGQGVMIEAKCSMREKIDLSFQILQSTKRRFVKTEFISCPRCGRTQYEMQKVSMRVRESTKHLVGLKIAIMGCIVNGPGEMQGADYGIVGIAADHVQIYVREKCFEKNVHPDQAHLKLVKVIKKTGGWQEPNPNHQLLTLSHHD